MGLSSIKKKATKGINKIKDSSLKEATVEYTVKVPGEAEGTTTTVTKSANLKQGPIRNRLKTDIESLKKTLAEDYNSKLEEGQAQVKPEDITVMWEGKPVSKGKLPLDFKFPNDPLVETWAPGRLFERATKIGEGEGSHVVRESTWLGRKMREALGEDFDVSFSDEAILARRQNRYINKLAGNLFGGMESIKNEANKWRKIMNSEEFKSATPEV